MTCADAIESVTHLKTANQSMRLALGALIVMASGVPLFADDKTAERPIKIVNPKLLTGDDVPAVRTPLGIPNDYKPWIVPLKNGELLIVAFCYG